jgi:hypothetical protein
MSLDMDVESDNDDDEEEDQGQWSAEEVGPEEGEADDTGEMDGQNAENQGPTARIEAENERKNAGNENGEPLPTVPSTADRCQENEVVSAATPCSGSQRRHDGTTLPVPPTLDDLVVVDPVICAAEEREIPPAPVSESEVDLLPISAETIAAQDKSAGNAQAESETGKRIVNNDMPAEELPPPALTTSVKPAAASEVARMQEKGDTIHKDKDNPIMVPVVRDESGVGIGDIATPAASVASPPLTVATKPLQSETNLISERTSQERKMEEKVINIPVPVQAKSLPVVSPLDKTVGHSKSKSEDLNKNKDNKQQEGQEISTQHQRRWPLSGRQQPPLLPPADQQKQQQELQQLQQKQQPQPLAKIPVECQPAPPARHKLPAALPTHKLPAALPSEAAAGVGMVGRLVGTGGSTGTAAAVTSCKICGRQYTARRDFYRNRNITSFLGILVTPLPVLRIRDVYPGSRILIFTHPGSRIQKQQQKRGMKKNLLS